MAEKVENDADLARLLKQAKQRSVDDALRYALVARGAADGKLLLSKKKIAPSDLADAKKSSGGKLISRGVCYGEDGKLVFESAKAPPATLPKLVKMFAKRDAGLMIMAIARQGGQLDDEDGSDELEIESEETGSDVAVQAEPTSNTAATSGKPVIETPQAKQKPLGAVAYGKLLLAWDQAKKKSAVELQKLEKTILDEFAGDPDLNEIRGDLRQLDDILGHFDNSLADELDAAMSSADDAVRASHHQAALAIISRYLGYVDSDPFLKELQTNPFMPLTVQATLSGTLKVLAKNLPA